MKIQKKDQKLKRNNRRIKQAWLRFNSNRPFVFNSRVIFFSCGLLSDLFFHSLFHNLFFRSLFFCIRFLDAFYSGLCLCRNNDGDDGNKDDHRSNSSLCLCRSNDRGNDGNKDDNGDTRSKIIPDDNNGSNRSNKVENSNMDTLSSSDTHTHKT